MANVKTLGFSSSEPGTKDLFIDLDITLTTVAGTTPSVYTVFGHTFDSAPEIIGAPNLFTTGASTSAAASTTGITLYAYQASTDAPDATGKITCYVKGKLA